MVGYCRYCQQGRSVDERDVQELLMQIAEKCIDFEITEERTQNAANHIATQMCICDGAAHERWMREALENAIANIEQIFGEKDEYMVQYLKEGAEMICKGHVKKITIDTGKGIKAIISYGKDGIRVKREKKITEEAV